MHELLFVHFSFASILLDRTLLDFMTVIYPRSLLQVREIIQKKSLSIHGIKRDFSKINKRWFCCYNFSATIITELSWSL